MNDGGALAEIAGAYQLSFTGTPLTVAQALALGAPILTHITAALPVRDASATIVTNLGQLEAIAGSIHAVTFTNGTTPTLLLTAAVASSDAAILALASGYNLAISGTFTAAQAASLGATVAGHLTTGAVVSDTSANVSLQLAALETLAMAGDLATVTITDGNTLTVTPTQLDADLAVFRKITNNYAFALNGSLLAGQAASISSLLSSRLPSTMTVTDSAANVFTYLDALQALAAAGHLASITLNDGGTPVLEVTADQLTSDAAALAIITGTFTLQITGGITAAQAIYYANNIATLGAPVNVVDSAAAVQAALASLETLAGHTPSSLLNSVVLTDAGTPVLALTTTAFVADASALLAILSAYTITLTGTLTIAQIGTAKADGLLALVPANLAVEDTAANIATDLALGSSNSVILGSLSQITSIVPDGGPLTLTVALAEAANVANGPNSVVGDIASNIYDVSGALVSDITGLEALVDKPTGIALNDAAADIETDVGLGGSSEILTNLSHITSITVSSGGPLVLTVAEAEVAGLVGKITGHTYDVTGALVSDLATLDALPYVPTGVSVTDSATNIAADLSAGGPELLAVNTHLTSLTVTGGPLTLTAAEAGMMGVNGSTGVLSKLTVQTYDVAAALVSDLVNLRALTFPPAAITLSDSATNIATDLGLGAGISQILTYPANVITAIAVTAGSLTLTVAEAETVGVAGSTGVINHIAGHAYNVTGAAVSDISTLELPTYKPTSIAITDTLANIQTDLSSGSSVLIPISAAISAITLNGGGTTISLTEAQTIAGGSVLQKIGAQITLSVTGVTVAEVTAVVALAINQTLLLISDTALNVNNDLASVSSVLAANSAAIHTNAITLTGGSTTITLTEAQATAANVSAVLNDISNLSTFNVTGVTLAQMTTVLGLAVSNTQMAVSDLTATIESDLTGGSSTLVAHAAHISGITLSDVGVLSLTVAQMVTDSAVLALLPAYQVVDTATDIRNDLANGVTSTILTHLAEIAGITVSSGTLTLTVAEAETLAVTGTTGVVNDITGHIYDVAGALVSDLVTLEGLNFKPAGITLDDTSADIAADLSLGVGPGSKILQYLSSITGITVSDGTLVLTAAEARTTGVADSTSSVLSKITNNTYDVAAAPGTGPERFGDADLHPNRHHPERQCHQHRCRPGARQFRNPGEPVRDHRHHRHRRPTRPDGCGGGNHRRCQRRRQRDQQNLRPRLRCRGRPGVGPHCSGGADARPHRHHPGRQRHKHSHRHRTGRHFQDPGEPGVHHRHHSHQCPAHADRSRG